MKNFKFLTLLAFLFAWCGIATATDYPDSEVSDDIVYEITPMDMEMSYDVIVIATCHSIFFHADGHEVMTSEEYIAPTEWIEYDYVPPSLSNYPLQLYHKLNTNIMGNNGPELPIIKEKGKDNKTITAQAPPDPTVKTTERRYTGPDYKSAVVLPDIGSCDPKNWDQERIRRTISDHPNLVRYFDV